MHLFVIFMVLSFSSFAFAEEEATSGTNEEAAQSQAAGSGEEQVVEEDSAAAPLTTAPPFGEGVETVTTEETNGPDDGLVGDEAASEAESSERGVDVSPTVGETESVEPEPEAAHRTSGPPHCHGQHQGAWTFEDTIVTRTNNFGFANGIRVSRCWPLFTDRDREGIMFALSNVEIGLVNWLAPVFLHLGGFASITPISLLTFGVEVTGYYWWPSTLTSTGHIAMEDYDDRFTSSGILQNVPEEALEDAFGLNVVMSTTLRGRVRIGDISTGTVHFILANTLNFEYWRQGTDDYYWSLRADAIFAKSDWALTNRAVALFNLPVSPIHSLRIGLYDELLYSLGDTNLQRHQVGGLLGLNISRLGNRIRNFETVLIVTGMTHLIREMRGFPPLNFMLKISVPLVWPRGS